MLTGEKIKSYLEENGISQSFVSEKTKIANNTLSNMLNGKRRITADEYFLICDVLNKQYDFFQKYKAN